MFSLARRFHDAVRLFIMTSTCGKNKNVANKSSREYATGVLTTFWHLLWSNTHLLRTARNLFAFHNKGKNKLNVNDDVVYTSILRLNVSNIRTNQNARIIWLITSMSVRKDVHTLYADIVSCYLQLGLKTHIQDFFVFIINKRNSKFNALCYAILHNAATFRIHSSRFDSEIKRKSLVDFSTFPKTTRGVLRIFDDSLRISLSIVSQMRRKVNQFIGKESWCFFFFFSFPKSHNPCNSSLLGSITANVDNLTSVQW